MKKGAEMDRKRLYREMLRIRRVEEAVADRYAKQQMRCPIHLSIGQEAVPVAISALLGPEDRAYSSHRCHAHYLAKGGDLNAMIAELHGRVTGCAKGKGGSMHLVDVSHGMMGSSALVAGSVPLAVGSALKFRLAGEPRVSVAYLGDGGTEEGVFYECLNFAQLKKLPVLFVVENNHYATYSHQRARQASLAIAKRGQPFGMATTECDGYDLDAVWTVSVDAVTRARSGVGPTLLEFSTYRWRDHVGPATDWAVGYRTEAEGQSWIDRCPLATAEKELLSSGEMSIAERDGIEAELASDIDRAFEHALSSPVPPPEEMMRDIYA